MTRQLVRVCLECDGGGGVCWQCGGTGHLVVDSVFDADVRITTTTELLANNVFLLRTEAEDLGRKIELTAEDDADQPWRG